MNHKTLKCLLITLGLGILTGLTLIRSLTALGFNCLLDLGTSFIPDFPLSVLSAVPAPLEGTESNTATNSILLISANAFLPESSVTGFEKLKIGSMKQTETDNKER
jgi:hypothetical protein